MSALAQLRHAYHQLILGGVQPKGQKRFADGLIAPAIREMERAADLPPPFRKQGQQIGADGQTTCNCDLYCKEQVTQLQEQNTCLDKVASDLQDLCDKQAKMLGERDAVLRQALEALEIAQADDLTPNAYEAQRQAIAAIKGVLNGTQP